MSAFFNDLSTGEIAIWGFAVYLLLALSYSYFRSRRINTWPHVTGKLKTAEVEYMHALERGSAWHNVEYEYEVDGKSYVGTRLSPLGVYGQVAPKLRKQLAKIQYVSKDQVKVFYDQKDPSKSYLVRETWLDIFR